MELVFKGLKNILSKIYRCIPFTGRGVERGLVESWQRTLDESLRIVPIDTGKLRDSAFLRKEGSGHNTEVVIGYKTEYALYVHEIPPPYVTHGQEFNKKHAMEIAAGFEKPRRDQEQYHFLSDAVFTIRKEILRIVADNITKEIRNL